MRKTTEIMALAVEGQIEERERPLMSHLRETRPDHASAITTGKHGISVTLGSLR